MGRGVGNGVSKCPGKGAGKSPSKSPCKRLCRAALTSLLALGLAASAGADSYPYPCRVENIVQLTHDVRRITFRAPDQFRFGPGQFVLLEVPDPYVRTWNQMYGTSHGQVSRPYSFASAPSRLPVFDLIIKHQPAPRGNDVPPGLASTFVHSELKAGDVVAFGEPMGGLYSAGDGDRPIILVAGGAGVSPFVGLLEHLFENKVNERRKIYLYLGVRGRRDLLLHDQFAGWAGRKRNFSYVPALSSPAAGDSWEGETGYINLVLDKHFPAPLDADLYVAGSPIMMRETVKVLKAKGLGDERIHHDPTSVQ